MYDHTRIEAEARERWNAAGYGATNLTDAANDPYYLLIEFPYPSGDLHIGHWYAFAVTDIYARMLRARGKNVLFPIGFDAFGLPAENAAIKNGADPKAWTYHNMDRMRAQLKSMGASFDWSKEVVTCEPDYYRWTQWLFTKLFEHGLAERRRAPVKWCPKDQTVLANEQVTEGTCERCGTPVEEKNLTQWFLKITEYAERLRADLDALPWREDIKEAQRAWIGKSEGARIRFQLVTDNEQASQNPQSAVRNLQAVEVFTTRPDTLFGATYLVLAPEHPFISEEKYGLTMSIFHADEVRAYVEATKKKTERERSENREKTGVKLEGIQAINPATKEKIPVYVADYVLASYGTGAVMAVPAHDERDYEFAQTHGLPVRQVVAPYFVAKDGERDAIRADKPTIRRKTISAIVKHWSEEKYLCLDWGTFGWHSGIIGGIEEGEDAIAAATREIIEETGYQHPIFQKSFGDTHNSFYAAHKEVNRYAQSTAFFFTLADGAWVEPDPAETKNHKAVWISAVEMDAFLNLSNFNLLWRMMQGNSSCYTGDGILVNSGEFSGRGNREASADIAAAAGGAPTTQYRMRDWLVSRQRYWGCPIPVVYDPSGKPHAVPAEHLPWLLPTDVDFTPTGKAPLASSAELRERVIKIFGEGWTPEYDTLDTFVDSSWYFLRYLDPRDDECFSSAKTMQRWLPVSRYSGGSEHTTMHLLYARFFHKALYDLALVPTSEPFLERFNRGLILGTDGQKMSKRWGNVINPDDLVRAYGADAVRLYLAFIGPYNEAGSYPWNPSGVPSMRKFLERVARAASRARGVPIAEPLARALARASVKIAQDGDRFKFNTSVAVLMSLLNEFEKLADVPQAAIAEYLLMLAPFAPHLAEHLYASLGETRLAAQTPWPSYDARHLESAQDVIAVQVNGKARGALTLAKNAEEAAALREARALPAVARLLAGREPARVIYVKGKVLNIVLPEDERAPFPR